MKLNGSSTHLWNCDPDSRQPHSINRSHFEGGVRPRPAAVDRLTRRWDELGGRRLAAAVPPALCWGGDLPIRHSWGGLGTRQEPIKEGVAGRHSIMSMGELDRLYGLGVYGSTQDDASKNSRHKKKISLR